MAMKMADEFIDGQIEAWQAEVQNWEQAVASYQRIQKQLHREGHGRAFWREIAGAESSLANARRELRSLKEMRSSSRGPVEEERP